MKNLTRYISERFEGFALLGGYLAIAYVAILILAALTAFVASIFISLGALIFNVDLKEGGLAISQILFLPIKVVFIYSLPFLGSAWPHSFSGKE